jgi:hypothetical protein
MTESDVRFVGQAIRRERVFRVAMGIGVAAGLCLLGLSVVRGATGEAWGPTFVIAILVLLNARQNLRQCRYARVLRALTDGTALLDPECGDDG